MLHLSGRPSPGSHQVLTPSSVGWASPTSFATPRSSHWPSRSTLDMPPTRVAARGRIPSAAARQGSSPGKSAAYGVRVSTERKLSSLGRAPDARLPPGRYCCTGMIGTPAGPVKRAFDGRYSRTGDIPGRPAPVARLRRCRGPRRRIKKEGASGTYPRLSLNGVRRVGTIVNAEAPIGMPYIKPLRSQSPPGASGAAPDYSVAAKPPWRLKHGTHTSAASPRPSS